MSLNVPANRNALPKPIMSGQKPVYSNVPLPSAPSTMAGLHQGVAKQVLGNWTPPPATLPVNTGKVPPVRSTGPVAGVGDIRKLSLSRRGGKVPGPIPGSYGPTGGTAGGPGGGGAGGAGGAGQGTARSGVQSKVQLNRG
jgi:hypothetical protein